VWKINKYDRLSLQAVIFNLFSSLVTGDCEQGLERTRSLVDTPVGSATPVPESSVDGVTMRHNTNENTQGDERLSLPTVGICAGLSLGRGRLSVESQKKGPLLARDVFEYHHKSHLIDLIGHLKGGSPSWKMIASYLGCSDQQIKTYEGNSFQQRTKAAELMYGEWELKSDATVEKLTEAVKQEERDDIVDYINKVLAEREQSTLVLEVVETKATRNHETVIANETSV
jgi:hypothetical protein